MLAATHMAVRSTASDDIITWIDTIRTDPKMNCPNFCKILMLDKAGEWLRENPTFFQQCTERGISVTNPPAKSDKRMMSRGEMAVQIVKRRTRAIMKWNWEASHGVRVTWTTATLTPLKDITK
eukprot:COSAG01_NODE_8026_length_2949_cov_186.367018_1_plen_123_part_00